MMASYDPWWVRRGLSVKNVRGQVGIKFFCLRPPLETRVEVWQKRRGFEALRRVGCPRCLVYPGPAQGLRGPSDLAVVCFFF